MIDLYLLVEGQTEEAFAKTVLGPHLARFEVAVTPIVVKTSDDPITGQKRKFMWPTLAAPPSSARRRCVGLIGCAVAPSALVGPA